MMTHESSDETTPSNDLSRPWRVGWILQDVTRSLRPTRLLLGLLAACLLLIGGRGWDLLTPASAGPALTVAASADAEQQLLATLSHYSRGKAPLKVEVTAEIVLAAMKEAWQDGSASNDLARYKREWIAASALAPRDTFEALTERGVLTSAMFSQLLLAGRPDQALLVCWRGCLELPGMLWSLHPFFTLFWGAWCLVVSAVVGTAIARTAACDRAGLERPTPRAALVFSVQRIGATIGALATPVGLVALLLVLAGTGGLLFLVPGVNIAAGVLYPLFLIAGALIVFVALGALLGGVMLLPAVASESCDAIDAVQRTFGYALNRPGHLVVYGATALAAFTIGWAVVAGFTGMTLEITAAAAGIFGSSPALESAGGGALLGQTALFQTPSDAGATDRITAGVVQFWQGIAGLIVVGWIISWMFSTGTTMYLLLRDACDGQRPEAVWHEGLAPGTLTELPETG